ncbi:MAG: hypothetical protein CL885_00175 [Dehalococcoidia bacterium]|nr:hypothetical protein [Dehalococcoidia bacterium]|tara:strand:- start:1389 stop:2324 length:936 start_codon:yes stop_codon:yes gene_type:complete
MSDVIYTVSIYEENSPKFIRYSLPSILNHANQVGADWKLISTTEAIDPKLPFAQSILDYCKDNPGHAHFYKLYALIDFVFSQHSRMMLVDDDILIKHNAINLFRRHEAGTLMISEHETSDGYPQLHPTSTYPLLLTVMDSNGGVHHTETRTETANERGDIRNVVKRIPELSEEAEGHLLENFKTEINSGLYVIDKLAANRLVAKFANDFHDGINMDQGYVLGKIGEAKIPCKNIPDRAHINPLNYESEVIKSTETTEELLEAIKEPCREHYESSFFHFNGEKNRKEYMEEFFLANKSLFFTPVFHVGTMDK